MENIPMNWCRKPYMTKISEILKLCFGTYDVNNNFSDLKTNEVFDKIFRIGKDIHDLYFPNTHDSYNDPLSYLNFNAQYDL